MAGEIEEMLDEEELVRETIKNVNTLNFAPAESPFVGMRLVDVFGVLIDFVRTHGVEVSIKINGIEIVLRPTDH